MDPLELVPISQIHETISPFVNEVLLPMGFEVQKDLHWVRSTDAPIRQMFRFCQWKGGQIAPAWGLSFDFVPHVSGATIKWHRTAKSARFDLIIDSRDATHDISYVRGCEEIFKRAHSVVLDATSQAHDFWDSARSISQLPDAFERLKERLSGGGLGFYNYVQHPIAYAFSLSMNGRSVEAVVELDRFLSSHKSDAVRERLASLLAAASAHNK